MMKRLTYLFSALLLVFALSSFNSSETIYKNIDRDEVSKRIPELKAWGTVTAINNLNGTFTFRHCDSGTLSTVDRNGVSLTIGKTYEFVFGSNGLSGVSPYYCR